MLRYMGREDRRDGESEMSRKSKQAQFMIWKGDLRLVGAADKISAVKILARFLEKVLPGTEVFEGRHILCVTMPDVPGDRALMQSEVLRKVDLVGAGGDAEIDRRAEYAKELFDAAKLSDGTAGTEILRYQLDAMLMQYDIRRE